MSELSELLTDLIKGRSTESTVRFGQENSIEHYGENIWEVVEHISEDYSGKTMFHGEEIEVVDQWGGYEGGGDSMGYILKHKGQYVALTGWYDSWGGSEFNSVTIVSPKERLETYYVDEEGKEVDRHYN